MAISPRLAIRSFCFRAMWRHDIASRSVEHVLSEEALERALAAAGLSAPVRWDDVTESTNATALVLAAEGAPSWTLVAASHQTAGRGRHGRVWRDRPGSALLCSLVLRPNWPPDRVGLVSLAAGAAMAEAVSEIVGRGDPMQVAQRPHGRRDRRSAGSSVRRRSPPTASLHVVVGIGVNIDVARGRPGGRGDRARGRGGPPRGLPPSMLVDAAGRPPRRSCPGGGPSPGPSAAASRPPPSTAKSLVGVAVDIDDTGALLIDTDVGPVRVGLRRDRAPRRRTRLTRCPACEAGAPRARFRAWRSRPGC